MAKALARFGRVEVVVPDRERSWVGKAITRRDEIEVERVIRDGVTIHTTTGYPADCTQLGVHSLFEGPPTLVISGINVGYNHGSSYLLSSGTVGAAIEAWIAGIPAVALSAGTNDDWPAWSKQAWRPESADMWNRLAGVSSEIIESLLAADFSSASDIVSINLPGNADETTPRRIAKLARTGYDRLFAERGPGKFAHEYGGGILHRDNLAGTDIEIAGRGEIAITPLNLPRSGDLPESMRSMLET